MAKFIKVIEKATGVEYRAEAIEGGFQVYLLSGEAYKKLRESTFKKYFKPVKNEEAATDSKKQEAPVNPEPEVKAAEAEQQPKAKAEKKASKEKATEQEAKKELSPEEREKMIEKVKKILALAENNPSQEEALSAALQAQRLMAKYNIHEDDVELDEIKENEIDSVFSEQKHDSSFHSWRKQLATVVAKNFRCKCYLRRGDVVFRGFKADAEIALEVYLTLYAIGDKLGSQKYKEELARTGSGKGVYTSFTLGFVLGVEEALNQQCTALLVITPKAVEEEWEQFSAGFGKSKATSTRVNNYDAFSSGKTEGKAAVTSRGIETTKKNK